MRSASSRGAKASVSMGPFQTYSTAHQTLERITHPYEPYPFCMIVLKLYWTSESKKLYTTLVPCPSHPHGDALVALKEPLVPWLDSSFFSPQMKRNDKGVGLLNPVVFLSRLPLLRLIRTASFKKS